RIDGPVAARDLIGRDEEDLADRLDAPGLAEAAVLDIVIDADLARPEPVLALDGLGPAAPDLEPFLLDQLELVGAHHERFLAGRNLGPAGAGRSPRQHNARDQSDCHAPHDASSL